MEKQLSFLGCMPEPKSNTQPSEKKSKPPTQPVEKLKPRWQIFVDGAARGNPGPSGAGIYVVDHQIPLIQKGIFLGNKTNNQAEYLALLLAIFFARSYCESKQIPIPYLHFISDSELLIKQLNGFYSVKNPILIEFNLAALAMLKDIPHTFTHVVRAHNKHADALANKGVDKRTKIPTDFLKFVADYNPLVVSLL